MSKTSARSAVQPDLADNGPNVDTMSTCAHVRTGTGVQIPLSQGYFTWVDEPDAERVLAAGPWHVYRRADTCYAIGKFRGRATIFLHRFILDAPRGMEVDHIDRDGLNNRRANLRLVTRAQQMMNRRGWGKSRFKGVSPSSRGNGKWEAYISIGGKQRKLGTFASEEEAARAYDRLAIEHHGEYALTNEAMGLFEEGGRK